MCSKPNKGGSFVSTYDPNKPKINTVARNTNTANMSPQQRQRQAMSNYVARNQALAIPEATAERPYQMNMGTTKEVKKARAKYGSAEVRVSSLAPSGPSSSTSANIV